MFKHQVDDEISLNTGGEEDALHLFNLTSLETKL